MAEVFENFEKFSNVIQVHCPFCNETHKYNTSDFVHELSAEEKENYNVAAVCNKTNKISLLSFERINELISDGQPSGTFVYKGEEVDNFLFPEIVKDAVFRLNADEYAESKELLQGKYEKVKFNYKGRRASFYLLPPDAEKSGIIFIPETEQDEVSLERILENKEALSAAWIGRKQKQFSKENAEGVDDYLNKPMTVPFYVVGRKSEIDELKKLEQKRKDIYFDITLQDADLRKTGNNGKEATKKQLKTSIKRAPKTLLRRAVLQVIPLGVSAYAGYRLVRTGIKIYDLMKNRSGLESELSSTDKSIDSKMDEINNDLDSNNLENVNGDKLEDYTEYKDELEKNVSNSAAEEVAAKSLIADGTEGGNNLASLDDYMVKNGAVRVDEDGDNFTDYYLMPNGDKVTDPINDPTYGVRGDPKLSEDDCNEMEDGWDKKTDYEAKRDNHNSLTNSYDSFNEDYNDLSGMFSNKSSLGELLTARLAELDVQQQLFGTFCGIGASAVISLIAGYLINKRIMKSRYGSKYGGLKEEDLKKLYKHKTEYNEKILHLKNEENVLYFEERIQNLEKFLKEEEARIKEEGLKLYFGDETDFAELKKRIKSRNKQVIALENDILNLAEFREVYEVVLEGIAKELKEYKVTGFTGVKPKKFVPEDLIKEAKAKVSGEFQFGKKAFDKDFFFTHEFYYTLEKNRDLIIKSFSWDYADFSWRHERLETQLPNRESLFNIIKGYVEKNVELKDFGNELTELKKQERVEIFKENQEELSGLKLEFPKEKERIKKLMYEKLPDNPALIFTKQYKYLDRGHFNKLGIIYLENKADLDKAGKKMRKYVKKNVNIA